MKNKQLHEKNQLKIQCFELNYEYTKYKLYYSIGNFLMKDAFKIITFLSDK